MRHRTKSSSGIISCFSTGLKALLNIPVYCISILFPRDEHVWIFGAWFGERYCDNSKYLFEYVNRYQPKIKAYWLSQNKNIVAMVKSKGYRSVIATSIKGYLISLKAKYAFISTSIMDINPYTTARTQIIQLWHGIPLKKIFYDDQITFGKLPFIDKLMLMIFPFFKKNYQYTKHYFVVNSLEERQKISSAFRMHEDRILITGSPRLDSMSHRKKNNPTVNKIMELHDSKQIVALYAPTHRQQGVKGNLCTPDDLKDLQKVIEKNNIHVFINMHFYHNSLDSEPGFLNIHFLTNDQIEGDIYSVLSEFDMLITDYSSIYFDYLQLDRPIIFYPHDLDEYTKKDREFYYSYDDVTPGPKVLSFSEMGKMIYEQYHNDSFKTERQRIRKKFLHYTDGKNSERLCTMILRGKLQ